MCRNHHKNSNDGCNITFSRAHNFHCMNIESSNLYGSWIRVKRIEFRIRSLKSESEVRQAKLLLFLTQMTYVILINMICYFVFFNWYLSRGNTDMTSAKLSDFQTPLPLITDTLKQLISTVVHFWGTPSLGGRHVSIAPQGSEVRTALTVE